MSLSVLVAASGCKSKKQDDGGGTTAGSGTAAATGTGTGTGSAAGTGTGSAAGTGTGSAPPSQAGSRTVEGAACPTGTQRVTGVPIKLDGAKLSFARSRGGGCPQKPVYLAYYTKGEPMPVMVCYDPDADLCEMMIVDEPVSIDLTDALKAAGATTATLAK
ncbi:MAG: hypothetical protein KA201_32940 [Kofleriaceae bacterium]|nr:hypothetical protein [Kofleriaceae bacterium]